MNPLRIQLLALAAASLLACTSETTEPEPEPKPEPDAAAPDAAVPDAATPDAKAPEPKLAFTIELAEDKLPILQGTSETLVVAIERDPGFTESIKLTAAGLPQGVTMAEVTVAADDDEATVELRAPESAPHSLPTKVTIKGTAATASDDDEVTVTVYGAPGSLDTSFEGGKVVVPVGRADDYARAVAVDEGGRIVVAGSAAENLGDFTVLRLERDGEVDATFGEDGVVSTQVGTGADLAYAVAVQDDGKILVAGSTAVTGTNLDFGLVRYNEDGSLDEDFGDGGKVITGFGEDTDRPYAILIQDDGKIVLGGESSRSAEGTGLDFALARYNTDGSLDEDFGNAGKVLTAIASAGGGDSIYALAFMEIDGEQMILAAGGEGDFKAARYHEDGTLDATFGEGGTVDGLNGSTIGAARAIAATEDGSILIAGHSMHDFAVVKLDADGAFDPSFGEDGKALTAVNSANWDEAKGMAIEADGKIVVGGWTYEGNSTAGNFALIRYTEDGVLDDEFGDAGIVITEVAAPMRRDEGAAVALQSDDRIPAVRVLVAGWAASSNSDFAVTRYWSEVAR